MNFCTFSLSDLMSQVNSTILKRFAISNKLNMSPFITKIGLQIIDIFTLFIKNLDCLFGPTFTAVVFSAQGWLQRERLQHSILVKESN